MSTRVKTLRGRRARHDHRPRHRAKNLARGTSAVGHVSDFVFPSSCSAPATGDGSRPVTVGGAAARPHRRRSPVPRSPWGARRPVRTPPLSRPRPRAAATAASAPDGARADAPPRGPDYQGRRRGSSLEETRAFNDARRATRAEPSRNLPDMVIVFRRSANRS